MILRPAKLGIVAALAVAGAIACGAQTHPIVQERPGAPAYWESNVPAEPARKSEHGGTTGGTPAGMRPEGTTDKFLWSEGTDSPTPGGTSPDSQTPLRLHDAVDKVDGGADGGEGAGPP